MLTISDLRPDAEVKNAIDTVVAKASSDWSPLPWEGEYPLSGFGIRQMISHDVTNGCSAATPGNGTTTATYWYDVAQVAAGPTFADWINTTTSRDSYIIVEGIFNLTPQPNYIELWPNPNGQALPVVPLDTLYAMDVSRGWFSKPFAIQPIAAFQIQKKYVNAGLTERIGLLGHTVAKRAYLISRSFP
jgi:hypothetical protein